MRIIVIGAGKVGYQIAEALSREMFDVVVVEKNEDVINKVNENLDVLTMQSNGLVSSTLKQLEISRNDMV
ncbi:MAG TPA: Trk system potassium transporter TrkA, partial [Clostridiales bacterium]|nr:Trk system potassium transporter TrkA [Clostridiales bacterium]